MNTQGASNNPTHKGGYYSMEVYDMYVKEPRVQLTDSVMDIMQKMSEGNPGALTVCMHLLNRGEKIDPQDIMGGLGNILSFDTHGIYGSRIWMLYKDVCGEHLGKMAALLRAVQLGFFSDEGLDQMIDGQYTGEHTLDGLIVQVQERLPEFNIEAGD